MNEYQETWIAALAENPPKTRGKLAEISRVAGSEVSGVITGECCLGVACRALGAESRIQSGHDYLFYGTQSGTLPPAISLKLNIGFVGQLTVPGMKIAREFLANNNIEILVPNCSPTCLVDINDNTNITHKQMAELIKLLFENDGFVTYLEAR